MMSGLTLRLAPFERILINGAVVQNGHKPTKFQIETPGANILRLKDAIHPNCVKTPIELLVHLCQMILSGDIDHDTGLKEIRAQIDRTNEAISSQHFSQMLELSLDNLSEGNTYAAMKIFRSLLPLEAALLELRL